MEARSESEVLVVGAGPVGMVAAASLVQQGIRTQIIDRGFRPAARSYALALHPGTIELLDELGLADQILARGQRLERIAYYDGHQRQTEVQLSKLGGRFPFVLVLSQSVLEETLQEHLRSLGVRILWNHHGSLTQLDRGQVAVQLESLAEASAGYGLVRTRSANQPPTEAHAFYVIGADGYWSAVRQALDLGYPDLRETETFGVFELEADWSEDDEARVVFTGDSANVLWPLGGGRFRWSFGLSRDDLPPPRLKRRLSIQMGDEAYPYLAAEDLQGLIAERAPWFDAEIGEVTWSVAVRFERRLVESFGRDNIWLAGDSAHLAGPVGGHSMNVGMREARDLSRRIAAILRDGEPRDSLAEYGEERLAEWRQLLAVNGGPEAQAEASPWVRANARRIATSLPASGEPWRQLGEQLGLTF